MTKPDEFIDHWILENPRDCAILAAAVLYAFFNDSSEDGIDRVLNLEKCPDLIDIHNELFEAIKCTSIVQAIESIAQQDESCV